MKHNIKSIIKHSKVILTIIACGGFFYLGSLLNNDSNNIKETESFSMVGHYLHTDKNFTAEAKQIKTKRNEVNNNKVK